ncbi:MAG: hypothetical protein K6G42_05950 [Lachnospiraceae bacterium]|nr:hypothetical protein [Lachnospiraceae bacterium]
MSENNKINEDRLDEVSGGIIFDASGIDGADKNNPWEVLDDTTGERVAGYPSESAARQAAMDGIPMADGSKRRYNLLKVNWDQVLSLRNRT